MKHPLTPTAHRTRKQVTFATNPSLIFSPIHETNLPLLKCEPTSSNNPSPGTSFRLLHAHLSKCNPTITGHLTSFEGESPLFDPVGIKPQWCNSIPTASELYCKGFGHHDLNHSFTQEVAFKTVTFHILQSSFLDVQSRRASLPRTHHYVLSTLQLGTLWIMISDGYKTQTLIGQANPISTLTNPMLSLPASSTSMWILAW